MCVGQRVVFVYVCMHMLGDRGQRVCVLGDRGLCLCVCACAGGQRVACMCMCVGGQEVVLCLVWVSEKLPWESHPVSV